ncbi:DUF4212 domain-containing protein [Moraxella pluranimalium]|uniref:Sodium symporter small subunit domain-containing protein n=1 Tax=Moraxella pluranimalium TaxID=470453 RepID=A0A1T0CMD6_9GAMM|nr:DUF4212 domain-containing protein [Moraxella pluranimalium]OOS23507.1 hypothetical protein B0680_05955 [Moraxella pluranimalium]
MSQHDAQGYWKANVRLIVVCLVIWLLCSHGFAIWLRPLLAGIQFGGSDLGFWFGQQGSMICFILLIFYYSWKMAKIDKEFGVTED